MPTAAIIGATVGGSLLSSRAQRKAADKQAEGIENAQQISQEAARKARQDALGLYDKAFATIAQGFDQGRADLMAGRVRVNDLMRQSGQQVGNLLMTGSQQRQQALMGSTPQESLFGGMTPYQPLQRAGGPAAPTMRVDPFTGQVVEAPAPAPLQAQAPIGEEQFVAPDQVGPVGEAPAPEKPPKPEPMGGAQDMSRDISDITTPAKPEPRSALEAAVTGGAGAGLGDVRQTLEGTPPPPPDFAPVMGGGKPTTAMARNFRGGLDRANMRDQMATIDQMDAREFGAGRGQIGFNPSMRAGSNVRFTPDAPLGGYNPETAQGLPQWLQDRLGESFGGQFPGFGQQPPTPTPEPEPIGPTDVGQLDTSPITAGMDITQLPGGQYGLGGFESALRQGVAAQTGALRGGLEAGLRDVDRGFQRGELALAGGAQRQRQDLERGRGDISGGLSAGLNALRSATGQGVGAIRGQLEQGVGRTEQGLRTGRQDITTGRDAATGRLDPYAQFGEDALRREAALAGALGAEEQQAAYDAFIESPGQRFARERAEKSLMRTAAARGGLGGGQLMTELQEQAIGIAAQQQDQQLQNLRSLAGRGQQAAGTQAGYEFGAGQALAGMEQAAAQNILQGRLQAGGQMGQLYGAQGQSALAANQAAAAQLANIAAQQGMVEGTLGANLSNLATQQGLITGQAQQQLGQQLAGIYGGTAGAIGQARLGIGQQLAQDTAADRLAQLESQYGQNVAQQETAFNQNLVNIALQQAGTEAGQQTGLAALLSNLATGSGTQQANLAAQMGGVRAAGVTNPLGNALSSLGGMAAGGAFGDLFGGGGSGGTPVDTTQAGWGMNPSNFQNLGFGV